jgi:hypothetical protein
MYGKPVFGRDQAIRQARRLMAEGKAVSHICPVAIESDQDIIRADELRQAATDEPASD